MSAQMILLFILLAIAIYFNKVVVPRWRLRRAVNQVLARFRRHQATTPGTARTAEELGIKPPRSFAGNLLLGRNQNADALRILQEVEAISSTSDGKYYLREERAAQLQFRSLFR